MSHSKKNWERYDQKAYWSSCRVPVILVRFIWILNFQDRFSKNDHIWNCMNIRPLGSELIHAEGRTDGRTDRQTDRETDRRTDYDEVNSRFWQFCVIVENETSKYTQWKIRLSNFKMLDTAFILSHLLFHYEHFERKHRQSVIVKSEWRIYSMNMWYLANVITGVALLIFVDFGSVFNCLCI
jgi:hypothetical protein